MWIFRFILAASCLLLTSSCAGTSDAIEDKTADHPLVCDIPELGKVVNISYDSGHPDAYFRGEDSIVATIQIHTKHESRIHRLLLQRNGTRYSAKYTIPADAVHFGISVSPPGVHRTPESASSMVFDGDNYVERGLCHMMRRADDLTELDELLTDTLLTSTDEYAQWPVYIESLLFSRTDASNLTSAQWRAARIVQDAPELNAVERFNLHLALTLTAHALDDRTSFNQQLDSLAKNAHLFTSLKQPLAYTSQLVFSNVVNREIELAIDLQETAQDVDTASLATLCRIAVQLNTPNIYNRLFTQRRPAAEVFKLVPESIRTTIDGAAQCVQDLSVSEAANNFSLFYTAAATADQIGWNGDIEIFTRAMERLGDIPVWNFDAPSQCVSIADISGMRSGTYLEVARTLNKRGELSRAKEYFHKTLACRGNFASGARSLAAVALGKMSTQCGELDSAEKYWAAAELLGSPFADEVLDGIERLRDSLQLTPIDQDKLLAQYAEFTPPKVAHPIQGELKTEKGSVSYDSEEPIFLLFSSIGCSVCTELMPGLYRDLKQIFPPENVIIVSDDPVEVVKSIYGKDVIYAPMDREVAARHQVQILPSVQVVRKNNIEFKRPSLSNTTFEQLKQLFGPQKDK